MYNYLLNFYITANCAFFDNTDYRTNNNEKPHYVEILNHQKIESNLSLIPSFVGIIKEFQLELFLIYLFKFEF